MDQPKILNYLRRKLAADSKLMQEYAVRIEGAFHPLRPTQKIIKNAVGGFLQQQYGISRWWVMPGLRGVGKTTLLAQTYLQLTAEISEGLEANLLYLSLDETVTAGFSLAEVLEIYQTEILGDYFENLDQPTFIFIDEAQVDPLWALTLKTIYDRSRRVFILCTGSSALHLQMDANVAGRRARIETLHPLSFTEFQLLVHQQPIDNALRQQLAESLYVSSSASEVYEGLKELRPQVNRYHASCKPNSFLNYLDYGTLPFALDCPKTLLYRNIRTIVDKVLNTDLRAWQSFNTASLTAMPYLLNILATAGDVVSLPKLSQALNISRPQLLQILDALVKAELLIKVAAYGRGPLSDSRRPAKYIFTSAAVRASYFDLAGDNNTEQRRRGQLLEDIAGLYYYREFIATGKGRLSYAYSKDSRRQCDFILQIGNQRSIAIEFGLGEKDPGQVATVMQKIQCQYGLVFSKNKLSLDHSQTIAAVPLDYFLLL